MHTTTRKKLQNHLTGWRCTAAQSGFYSYAYSPPQWLMPPSTVSCGGSAKWSDISKWEWRDLFCFIFFFIVHFYFNSRRIWLMRLFWEMNAMNWCQINIKANRQAARQRDCQTASQPAKYTAGRTHVLEYVRWLDEKYFKSEMAYNLLAAFYANTNAHIQT